MQVTYSTIAYSLLYIFLTIAGQWFQPLPLAYNVPIQLLYFLQCDQVTALGQYFEMVDNPPVYIALVGTGCSVSTEPVAKLTHFWNFPMVS